MNSTDLNCVFCFKTPIGICECTNCGAPACSSCYNSKKKCIECSFNVFVESKLGEYLLSFMPINCNQCGIGVAKNEMNNHLQYKCGSLVVSCQVKNCNEKIARKDFPLHLLNKHEASVLAYIENPSDKSFMDNKSSLVGSQELSAYPNEFNGVWPSGSKSYIQLNDGFITFSCHLPINSFTSCKVLIKKTSSPGHIVVGLSDKVLNAAKGYLGGDFGSGTWGVSGNGSIGEEGKWTKGEGYKEGDIVEILYKEGQITYCVNGFSNRYFYFLKTYTNRASVYLSVTSFYKGVELAIL